MEAECVVCLQLYDEGDHTPRVLSCGHSVCHSCAADLISRWGGGNAIGAQLLRCAECKQHTKVPLGGILALPKNIELMRLVQGKPRTPIGNSVDESKNPRLVKANRRPPRQCDEDRESSDPCLVSEPRFGAPAIWILPQAAITKRADVAGGISVGEFLRGKKVHSVSLQFFSRIAPENRDRGLNYTELVRLAWNSLHHEVRGKLMRLVLLSCKFLAEVAGLWMSEEGAVFLVSKVYVEGIQQARSLFCPTEEGEGSSLKEYGVGRISVTTLIRLGLELCEVLLEVHAAGVVVGILDMNAFVLDSYGHLQVHVGSFLFWRRFVGAIPSCSKANSCISSLGVGVLALEKVDEAIGSSYESLSPEVLQIIKRFEDGNASSSCGEAEKAAVTPKADVWSLGYILLRLLSQQGILERNERFKEQLLNCMASVPSDRPRVVDVWWELKGLLEDQALGIPSDLGEESSEGKLDLCEDGSKVGKPHADDSTIEPGTSSEASADALEDPQPDAPRLSRALVDVDQGIGEVKTLRGHMDTISCLSVCGNYLISASFDKTLRVWSLNDYRLIQTFEGHEQRITALAVHEASELCVSGDYAGHICAWKLASPDNSAPVVTWQEHQDWRYSGVASLAISNDELLYSGSGDRTIKAWSTLGFKHVATMEGHKGVVSALMVEGQFLFSGSWDGTIRLWWRPDHSPLVSFGGGLSVPLCGIRVLVKSPASGLLFSGHDSGVIQIWNEEECVGTLKAHTGVVSALAFDQDWLYSSSWDGFVKAWPLEDILSGTSNPIERKCNQAAVTALCCSVQDKLFVGIKQEIQVLMLSCKI